jgi:hypothetical protein
MVYVIQVCVQLESRIRMELQYHRDPAHNLSANLYGIYHWCVNSKYSWWWTKELSETHRFSFQNKYEFEKLVHQVGLLQEKCMISIFVIISSFLITTDSRTVLFWVITQRLVVISFQRFRTTCPSYYRLLKMRTDSQRDRHTERNEVKSRFWNFETHS